MLRSKLDVDKHVQSLIGKLSSKEFHARAYAIARLYYDVQDYANCQKYVEQYLQRCRDNNAAAHMLLGQALQKLGQKGGALDQYKISLQIDNTQKSLILEIAELILEDQTFIDQGQLKYWYEKAEAAFPIHPITFRLQELLVSSNNTDPKALTELLIKTAAANPKDVALQGRLLKHYVQNKKFTEAFTHAYNIEFQNRFIICGNTFYNNYLWYHTVYEFLRSHPGDIKDIQHQLLLLTVQERLCALNLTSPAGNSKSILHCNSILHHYDKTLQEISKAEATSKCPEFFFHLIEHHRGQFLFYAATFLLKRGKKFQLKWSDVSPTAACLMLLAWQTVTVNPNVNWLKHANEHLQNAVQRWFLEGSHRCSQSGHYLLANIHKKPHTFIDHISQQCAGTQWKEEIYNKLFTDREQMQEVKNSYFVLKINAPILRPPTRLEIEAYDLDAQRLHPNSLHHFIWMLLNYKNFSSFKCTLFDMLLNKCNNYTNCGPETLNKLDVLAFLYSATFTAQQVMDKSLTLNESGRPCMLPANITDIFCSMTQMKWWDCVYKFAQNQLGSELTDIRTTLTRGIEVVRCVDNHGLDPELLCKLGRIFAEHAKNSVNIDDKIIFESRAGLYYSNALPTLDKLKNNLNIKIPDKRMFDYTHKILSDIEIMNLIEESKLFLGVMYINSNEYDKAIETLTNLKSPHAKFHLAEAYKKLAFEEHNASKGIITSENNAKFTTLLSKAKSFASAAHQRLKEYQDQETKVIFVKCTELIEEIEYSLNKVDSDTFIDHNNVTYGSNEHINTRLYGNVSSTPKRQEPNSFSINQYKSAIESQIFENTPVDNRYLERIENEIKILQRRDTAFNFFIEQTKTCMDESRLMGKQVMSTMSSNIENTIDQFKMLKLSLDQVKDQVGECRKEVAELKKQINKLKKSSEYSNNDNDLYNMDEESRNNTNAAQHHFTGAPFMPPFNQRFVPPVPYIPFATSYLHNQNLYHQYAQQPGVPPVLDPSRPPLNFAGIFTSPEQQIYAEMMHRIPPPIVPPVATTIQPPASTVAAAKVTKEQRQLPVNVVITSSDPLPTFTTTTAAPILSVTIPPEHIKGTPHNYQIQLPVTNDNAVVDSKSFNFMPKGNLTEKNSNTPTLDLSKGSNLFDTSFMANNTSFKVTSPDVSYNKSRTLSEKSNTSVENYDPYPDFKPIIPLPAEVAVQTGEEDEVPIFAARAKLYRFVDKQWKERGLGEMKLLKHQVTGKVRVLMRREQVHKVCANHFITPEMEIKPMTNELKAYFWVANDYAEENVLLEKFSIRFKTVEIAKKFYDAFEEARKGSKLPQTKSVSVAKDEKPLLVSKHSVESKPLVETKPLVELIPSSDTNKTVIGGFTFSSTPNFKFGKEKEASPEIKPTENTTTKPNVFSKFTFQPTTPSPFTNLFNNQTQDNKSPQKEESSNKLNSSDLVEEYEPTVDFKPVIPLPALVDHKTGEEDEIVLFEHRAKLLRFDSANKEWKERGLGNIKLLAHKDNNQKIRLLMRREQVMKICCNHALTKDMDFQPMTNSEKAVTWYAMDYSEGVLVPEALCLRFKTAQILNNFMGALKSAQMTITNDPQPITEVVSNTSSQTGFGDKFKPKSGTWECKDCFVRNESTADHCSACNSAKDGTVKKETSSFTFSNTSDGHKFKFGMPKNDATSQNKFAFGIQNNTPTAGITKQAEPATEKVVIVAQKGFGDQFKPKPGSWHCDACYTNNLDTFNKCACCDAPKPEDQVAAAGWGDQFKPKSDTWECKECFIRNDHTDDQCKACDNPKDGAVKKESTFVFNKPIAPSKFKFGISNSVGTVENAAINLSGKKDLSAVPSAEKIINDNSDNDSGDVIFISEIKSSVEDKEKAKALMLPENFFTYKYNKPCPGCRGCSNDDNAECSNILTPSNIKETQASESPAGSIYSTPANKTADISIFQTPTNIVSSTTKPSSKTVILEDKENTTKPNTNIFNQTSSSLQSQPQSIFTKPSNEAKFSFGMPKPEEATQKNVFGSLNTTSIFGNPNVSTKPLFSFSVDTKNGDQGKPEVRSIFGGDSDNKPVNIFGTASNIFGANYLAQNKESSGIFGKKPVFEEKKNLQCNSSNTLFGNNAVQAPSLSIAEVTDTLNGKQEINTATSTDTDKNCTLKVDNALSFAALSTSGKAFTAHKNEFQWKNEGQPVFSSANNSKNKSSDNVEGEEEYDPHYEPIVPLPDKIDVKTGEEDEEKLYEERSKLFRYNKDTHEWKERGVGSLKILFHPVKNTYRMLLRREQIHKVVLNTLLTIDTELLPMTVSNNAWTWSCMNYAEIPQGEIESLAVRFKDTKLANAFKDKVEDCVRKLQAFTARVIRQEKKGLLPTPTTAVISTSIPTGSTSAVGQNKENTGNDAGSSVEQQSEDAGAEVYEDDDQYEEYEKLQAFTARVIRQEKEGLLTTPTTAVISTAIPTGSTSAVGPNKENTGNDAVSSVEQQSEDEGAEMYEDDDQYEDYEDDGMTYLFSAEAVAAITEDNIQNGCSNAQVQIMYDPSETEPRLMVTDNLTGEILSDMIIHSEMDIVMTHEECSWFGTDITTGQIKYVKVTFSDAEFAVDFYDSFLTCKSADDK